MAEELEKELDDDVDSSDEEPKKGKAGRFELLTTQCMVCICALLVLFGIKFVGGAVYDDARAAYAGTYDDPTSANEVMGLISKVFGAPGGGGTEMQPAVSDPGIVSSPDAGSDPGAAGSQPESVQTEAQPEESGISSDSSDFVGPSDSDNAGAAGSDSANAGAAQQTSDKLNNNLPVIVDYTSGEKALKASGAGINSVALPASGKLTSTFGYRVDPITGVYALHKGIDLAVNSGTPVHAAMSGVVEVAGWDTGYGNYIILKHANGMETVYGHNSKLLVKVGQSVKQGDTISLSGSTGYSTGPHVHFEVRVDGHCINPLWLLPNGSVV